MPRIFPKASKMKTLGRCPARRRSSAVSYLKLIVKERANMVLMLTHHVHSAYSGDLKCTEDNKLSQISTARDLLTLRGSLVYKLNSSLCELEHLHRGALCKHNRDSTADIIAIMKTETGYSPDLFLFLLSRLLALCSSLPLFPSLTPSLWGPACIPYPTQVLRCPASPLLNICSLSLSCARGSYPPRHP